MPNVTELTVRYSETDAMGVVHHAVYPVWYEIARTDYIKAAGMSYADMERGGVMLPVTGITCNYRRPAHYDDVLEITARVTRLTVARIEFAYTITRKGDPEILATGTSSHGFVDAETFAPLNFKVKMPEIYNVLEQKFREDSEG